MVGVYYNGPKFKYQLLGGTGLLSYKIWTKNSKTTTVKLLKILRPFWNYNFNIEWEIHFLTFLKYGSKLFKKILEEKNGHFHFKSVFAINFWLREWVKRKIRKYLYFLFDHIPKSKMNSKSRFEMRMSIFLFRIFFKRVLANI